MTMTRILVLVALGSVAGIFAWPFGPFVATLAFIVGYVYGSLDEAEDGA